MIKFTDQEWEVIVAAYQYEIEHDAVLSDSSYDFFVCLVAKSLKQKIKDFDPNTGQWVHDLLNYPDMRQELKIASSILRSLGEGTSPKWYCSKLYSLNKVNKYD